MAPTPSSLFPPSPQPTSDGRANMNAETATDLIMAVATASNERAKCSPAEHARPMRRAVFWRSRPPPIFGLAPAFSVSHGPTGAAATGPTAPGAQTSESRLARSGIRSRQRARDVETGNLHGVFRPAELARS